MLQRGESNAAKT